MVVSPHRTDPELALEDSLPREITVHRHLTSHEAIHLMAILHANSHQLTHKHEAQTPAMLARDTKTNPSTNHNTKVKISTGPTTGTSPHVGVPAIPTTVTNRRVEVPVILIGAPIRIDLNKEVVSEVHKEETTSHKQTASQEEKSTGLLILTMREVVKKMTPR